VEAWPHLPTESLADLMARINATKGVEGCVLVTLPRSVSACPRSTIEMFSCSFQRFEDGRMYKIKSQWYVDSGKGNSDLLFQERGVWLLILNGTMDDVKARSAAVYDLPSASRWRRFHSVLACAQRFEEANRRIYRPTLRCFASDCRKAAL
jgi:hypothetical protein